jgi:hypothetical protein
VLKADQEETDLLFVETRHTYGQVMEEVRRHGDLDIQGDVDPRQGAVVGGGLLAAEGGRLLRPGGAGLLVRRWRPESSYRTSDLGSARRPREDGRAIWPTSVAGLDCSLPARPSPKSNIFRANSAQRTHPWSLMVASLLRFRTCRITLATARKHLQSGYAPRKMLVSKGFGYRNALTSSAC